MDRCIVATEPLQRFSLDSYLFAQLDLVLLRKVTKPFAHELKPRKAASPAPDRTGSCHSLVPHERRLNRHRPGKGNGRFQKLEVFRRSTSAFCWRHRFALGVFAVLLLTAPLGIVSRPLAVGDETREAAIAEEMSESREFFATRLAGQPLFEKPPFFYASVASSIRLQRGVTRLSTRLPSIFYSAIALAATAATASLLFSARAGFFSSIVLSTTYLFTVNAHNCVVDVSLAAFVSLALLAFVAESRRAGFPSWGPAFGAAAAGALLAKGFV